MNQAEIRTVSDFPPAARIGVGVGAGVLGLLIIWL